MKGVLYYFSGTGNTKWVAVKLRNCLRNYDIDLDIKSIEKDSKFNLRGYCFLVIGTPVYADIEPKLIEDFVKAIPPTEINVKCIIYSTQGGDSCSAINRLSKMLKERGYNVVIEAMIKMPNNFYFNAGKKPSDEVIHNLLQNAEDKVSQMAKDFNENKTVKANTFFLKQKAGSMGGMAYRRAVPRISKNITSSDFCKKCGLCLRNCPRGNITFENGRAIFHSNCILCLRCIYICPANAVLYKGKKIDQIQREMIKILELK